jgi:hypothetical protein
MTCIIGCGPDATASGTLDRVRPLADVQQDFQYKRKLMSLKKILSAVFVLVLVGCSSPQEISETGKLAKFSSKKPARLLAICINKNTDGAIGGSLVTSMNTLEPLKIVVRNANAVYAVIEIEEADKGAIASFRLGLLASLAPDTEVERMTKGCD